MNKGDLISAIASDSGLNKKQVESVLDSLIENIVKDVLNNGNSTTIPGLGTFRQKKTNARTGRNPKTGDAVQIPAKTSIGFKMASSLKQK